MEGMFGLARERLRMASNRHKQNRKKFYINKTIKGVRKKVAAKTEELPSYMVLPLFWTPSTLLINKIISIPLTIHGHAFYQIQDNSTELLHMHGPFSIDIPYNLESFARMLAKIAHCLAVGELGQENFDPCLLDIINGTDLSKVGSVIGHHEFFPHNWDYRNHIHHLSIKLISTPEGDYSGQWVCAGIQLFSGINPVHYTVVVGKLRPTTTILKWQGLDRLSPSQLEDFRRHYDILPFRHYPVPPMYLWAPTTGQQVWNTKSQQDPL
jgi:hypothetical protein